MSGAEEVVSGVERIEVERSRQIAIHGYDLDDDMQHTHGELIWSAAYYLEGALARRTKAPTGSGAPQGVHGDRLMRVHEDPDGWGFTVQPTWPFPTSPDPDPKDQDDIRCLEKAGALIAAEIDRRVRMRAVGVPKKFP